mmetsp:Transcript_17164/g.15154  ORF Transcript_17164/g.15154 Transcript_17164/m.15154 type:complete len:127 (-) Transcript_17164:184-564(-)
MTKYLDFHSLLTVLDEDSWLKEGVYRVNQSRPTLECFEITFEIVTSLRNKLIYEGKFQKDLELCLNQKSIIPTSNFLKGKKVIVENSFTVIIRNKEDYLAFDISCKGQSSFISLDLVKKEKDDFYF